MTLTSLCCIFHFVGQHALFSFFMKKYPFLILSAFTLLMRCGTCGHMWQCGHFETGCKCERFSNYDPLCPCSPRIHGSVCYWLLFYPSWNFVCAIAEQVLHIYTNSSMCSFVFHSKELFWAPHFDIEEMHTVSIVIRCGTDYYLTPILILKVVCSHCMYFII